MKTSAQCWMIFLSGLFLICNLQAEATATAEAMVLDGSVTAIKVMDGGSGYEDAPAVTLAGGGGSGATATAVLEDGAVSGITVLTAGNGYASAPEVVIAAPPSARPVLDIGMYAVVSIEGEVGKAYRIESASTPEGAWSEAAVVILSGSPFHWIDLTSAGKPRPFYRAVAGPAVPAGFVWIPSGTFTMGSPLDELGRDRDEPERQVTISQDFLMQRTEVTWAQWNEVRDWARANRYDDLPSGRNGYNGDASGTHPVTEVSWYDVVKWLNAWSEKEGRAPCYTVAGLVYRTGNMNNVTCDWAANGYRLPTEAEWEYACRAGTTTAFYTGENTNGDYDCDRVAALDLAGWYCGNSGNNTHPVGQKQANDWGLFDTHGNVWEWCWDWYFGYGTRGVTDPRYSASWGSGRVYRGGGWDYVGARYCRSACRASYVPVIRLKLLGFRPAVSWVP